ncbi:MAG: dipeptidyl aminopeptidase/acylaminoacyl peptidase, partial [Myxococcota bacterium]
MHWLVLTALAAPERTHDITPDDLLEVASVGGFDVAPSGRFAVYQEWRWSEAHDGRTADLWAADLAGGSARRLTFAPGNEGSPRVAPDGQHVYYTGAVTRPGESHAPWNGTNQVWRLPLAGGEPVPVTDAKDGVSRFDLTADGRTLWFTVKAEHPAEDPFAGLRSTHSGPQYGHRTAHTSTLWRLDLQTWRSDEVFGGERTITDMAVSPDGARVALLTTPDSPLVWNEGWSQVDVLDVVSGEVATVPDALWRTDGPSLYGWLEGLTWSPDSRSVAFSVGYDGYASEIYVAHGPALGQVREVDVADPWSFTGGLQWRSASDTLCFTVADHARMRLVCRPKDGRGAAVVLTPGDDAVVWGWDTSADGRVLVTKRGGRDHLGDLYSGAGKKVRRLTRVNPQIDTWRLPSVRLVSWTAPDGTPVEGVLELPPGWSPDDGPLPTVVHLHGGPTWATPYQLSMRGYGQTVFAARGWALLSPNYRGSIGYGDAFLEELVGRENDVEVADILAGVDHLIAEGIADGDELAVMGWSNGGYLTNCLISQTDRFAAASSGAGVFDQTLQWATEDTPGHVVNFMEGLPWEQPEEVQSASPLFAADKIRTPTVIHVGEHDPRVPAAHARALFRALNVYLDVPSELLVYPGEGHGLSKWSHRKAKLAWDI